MTKLVALAFSITALLTSGVAAAQSCPSGFPNSCGNDRCCPANTTCGGNCGLECCDIPSSGSSSSSGGGGSCPSGTSPCGSSHCVAEGDTCCASVGHEELYCSSGASCLPSGGCSNDSGSTTTGRGSSGGSGLSCDYPQAPMIASCGNDTCGCADPCTTAAGCASGCCSAAGFCAPSCVCGGSATYSACGGTFQTSDPDPEVVESGPSEKPSSSACSIGVVGEGTTAAFPAAIAALLALVGSRLRRRR